MVQQIKDAVLSLLWHKFKPWPGNLHTPWDRAEGKKKKKSITPKVNTSTLYAQNLLRG